MKSISCNLPREHTQIEIHTMADLHLGDKHCDMKLIKGRIEYIKTKDNAYCILNGDLLNNSTKTSVSDSYAEDMPPMEQVQRCIELLEPIKDKVLCLTTGNHELRTHKKEGIDLTEVMARQMGLYDKFSAGACLLFLRFGELSRGRQETSGSGKKRMVCYTVYAIHGSGGGRKEGAKAIRLADMASVVDADVYIHSHTHLPMIMKQGYFRTDERNSTAAPVTKLFVNTAAALDYGGYSEQYEFKPAAKDTPVIYLDGTRKNATALL